ncbi:MAG TPA: TIGR00730 family Rossman fold protein [bacterium]|nr:TIGR00730 family Rossman fold protein [bacterium]HPQ67059.1 TIGR00730 family Rossman fold protein [bacterium]
MKRICVFCGSSPGADPEYVLAARRLGRALAARGLTLVFGGARVGIMGQLARAALEAGGEVIGVIPRQLVEMEVAYAALPELRVVESMHERKALMAELADGFIALPGGLGTVEEFFEVLTWAQLEIHRKPCGLLDTRGYYRKLMEFLGHAVEEKFIEPVHREMIQIDESPAGLLDKFRDYRAPRVNKAAWIRKLTDEISPSLDVP